MADLSNGSALNRRGTWRTYTIADGLAALRTEYIIQDIAGYLWVATFDSGVSRFDGSTFRTFSREDGLPGNRVLAFLVDRHGRLWFATVDGGACWYDKEFHLPDSTGTPLPLTAISEDREGRIWVGGRGVLGYYTDMVYTDLVPAYYQQYGQVPDPEMVFGCWGIAQDAAGDLWFGFDYVVRYDGQGFQRYGPEEGVLQGAPAYTVASDLEGSIWVGSKGGLLRYDGQGFQQIPITYEGYARSIQCDRSGRLWVCGSFGVACYDGTKCLSFTPKDGLAYPSVNGMHQDREGLLWFATWGGGISCYDPHSIHLFKEEEIPKASVSALHEDQQGHLWIGFIAWDHLAQSVVRFDGQRYTPLGKKEGLRAGNWCIAIVQDATHKLWFGGAQGLFCWDGRTFHKVEGNKKELAGHRVSAISADPQGHLYIGHTKATDGKGGQISRYDGQYFQRVLDLKPEDLTHVSAHLTHVSTILVRDNGAVWFGSGNQGIGCLDKRGDTHFYTEAEGLIDNRVSEITEDRQGHLWIATLGGISRFDGTSFCNFTRKDGLPDNHVYCVAVDQQGHLWFGTDGGMACFKEGVLQSIRSPELSPIRKITQDKSGKLWLGLENGLASYRSCRISPRVKIMRVLADKTYLGEDIVEIPESTGQVIFEYQGLGFRTNPQDMLYTYRLQGYDETWQPPVRTLRVAYEELEPGNYTFEVRAIDRDVNSSAAAAIGVSIVPDPYRQALTETLNQSAGDFIGSSTALRKVQSKLAQVAPTDVTVLIVGETGTGKGVASRSLHNLSEYKEGPFVPINCGAIPESLIESELFGHEKGAFTGASSRKVGKVELAAGGTLFLDEIGDMPLAAQVKLLHLLDERRFERVGGTQSIEVDVRIVAATNRDLQQMVEEGTFRADLYFRLQVFIIQLPPLRDRRGDLPLLATYFMDRMAAHLHKTITHLDPEAIAMLQRYHWPGNVRELEHMMQRAVIVCEGSIIQLENLGLEKDRALSIPIEQRLTPKEYERQYLLDILAQFNWVIKGEQGAAKYLGLHEATLRSRIKKLGIKRPSAS